MTIYVRRNARARSRGGIRARDQAPRRCCRAYRPLGSLEEQEDIALFSGYADEFDESFLPAIDEIERRLILAQLILKWARALGHAIVAI